LKAKGTPALQFGHSLTGLLLREVFPHTKLHDVGDELVGQGLVQGELDGSPGANVVLKTIFKLRHTAGSRVESNVVFEGGEVHQIAVQVKGRNAVADAFGGIGSGL